MITERRGSKASSTSVTKAQYAIANGNQIQSEMADPSQFSRGLKHHRTHQEI